METSSSEEDLQNVEEPGKRKNAIARIYGSCTLRVMGSWDSLFQAFT